MNQTVRVRTSVESKQSSFFLFFNFCQISLLSKVSKGSTELGTFQNSFNSVPNSNFQILQKSEVKYPKVGFIWKHFLAKHLGSTFSWSKKTKNFISLLRRHMLADDIILQHQNDFGLWSYFLAKCHFKENQETTLYCLENTRCPTSIILLF